MRFTLIALGSRGDVQPFIALAVGLQKTGRHKVRFAAPDNFEFLAREHSLDFFPLGVDTQKMLGPGGIDPDQNLLLWFSEVLRSMKPIAERIADNTWLVCQDTDFIIYSMVGIWAYHVAEKLNIPCIMASPIPGVVPTRAYPNPNGIFPSLPLGGGYNRLTHILSQQLFQLFTGSLINRWRKEKLHLPAIPFGKYPYCQMGGRPQHFLGSYSPIVSPKPPDWGDHIHVCGYWFLDPAPQWQPPAQLISFLEAGSPPVYIGFGSMANRAPQKMAQLAQQALKKSGQRGILATGWGGLDNADLPDNIFSLDSAPHTWLFPHMAAVVHHGGAGTTGASFRAGIPSILVPHMGDQSFWAKRVTELGVGPQPIPRRKLTVERLVAAITTATIDKNMQARAASLGDRIRAEDGVTRAIELIEGFTQ
ncbi:MAG: glycosyltransferase family 1 protein [Anaerolineales bacterium]|nr:glycosyltransferase family 1 protein [Anaerolineales bacterium]